MAETHTQRIGSVMKLLMVSVAVILDLLPIALFVIAGGFMLYGLTDMYVCVDDSTISDIRCGFEVAWAATAGIGVSIMMFFLGGPIYYILSSLTTLFGYLLFVGWFGVLGYNMFGLHAHKFAANVLTFLLEMLPVLNLLPGMTLLVLRHLSLCSREDREKRDEEQAAAVNVPRRQQRAVIGAA